MRLSVAAAISHGRVYRRFGLSPRSRLDLLRNLVTALVRHERIETPWARADEMRGYAERVSGGTAPGRAGGGGQPRHSDPPPPSSPTASFLPAAHRLRQAWGQGRARHAHGGFLADRKYPSAPHPSRPAAVPGLSMPPRRRRTSSTSCSKCWRPASSRTPAATRACCRSPTGTGWTALRWR